MRFRITHDFEKIALPDYEELYFDEPFNEALCEEVNLERELLKLERDGDRLEREVRVAPRGRQIPKPVARLLGGARIEYIEKLQYTFGNYRGTWQSISSLMTEKIQSSGVFLLEAVPDGVRRIVEGEIKVKVFGLGGTIEQYIVEDVKKSYADAATFTKRWVAERTVS